MTLISKQSVATILLLGGVGVMGYFLYKKPSEVIQTKTITQVVTKVVTKVVVKTKYVKVHDHIVTNETIDVVKKDGTKEHIVENQTNTSIVDTATKQTTNTASSTQSITQEQEKIVTKYASNWLFGVTYNTNLGLPSSFDYTKSSIIVGYNILGPVFLTASVSADLKTQSIGVLIQP